MSYMHSDEILQMTKKNNENDKMHKVCISFNLTYIAKEAYQNFPEADQYGSFVCVDFCYGYDKSPDSNGEFNKDLFLFKFIDSETNKKYEINLKKAEEGISKMLDLFINQKVFFSGIDSISQFMDLGNWDGEVLDACVQLSIFGELVYG